MCLSMQMRSVVAEGVWQVWWPPHKQNIGVGAPQLGQILADRHSKNWYGATKQLQCGDTKKSGVWPDLQQKSNNNILTF